MTRPKLHYLSLHVPFAVLFLIIIANTLRAPQSEFGDGREYVLQTQAIFFDGTLAVAPPLRTQYFNDTNPFGVRLSQPHEISQDQNKVGEERQFGPSFGSLYLASDGSYRYIHSWVYSMVVVPVYAICHFLIPGHAEYLAFRIVNIIVLFVPVALLWRGAPTLSTLLFLMILLTSPITPHLQFAHPEVFCLGCVLLSFIAIRSPFARPLSPLILGVGASQNIPIALFFPLHLWVMLDELESKRRPTLNQTMQLFVSYGVGLVPTMAILLYNYRAFGTFNLIVALGQADFSYLSLRKLLSVFISPLIGCLWYFPASWVAVTVMLARRRLQPVILFTLSVLAVAAISSTTANINSAQLSACRYAVWYLAPLFAMPFMYLPKQPRGLNNIEITWLTFSLMLAGLILYHLGTYRFLTNPDLSFLSLQRAVPEVADLYRLSHFHDDVEPIVENITREELSAPYRFRGIYVWNLGGGESLWIVSKRAMKISTSIQVVANKDLSVLAQVRKYFDVSSGRSGRYNLRVRSDVSYSRHPYLGAYLILWVPAVVEREKSAAPVFVLGVG